MGSPLTFSTTWDAPFERVEVRFSYTPTVPAEGPSYASGGTPGEPGTVELLGVTVTTLGRRHDAPEWLADALAGMLADDLHAVGEAHEAEVRDERRSTIRRWAA